MIENKSERENCNKICTGGEKKHWVRSRRKINGKALSNWEECAGTSASTLPYSVCISRAKDPRGAITWSLYIYSVNNEAERKIFQRGECNHCME